MQTFVDRFRYKASKARQAQSRIKALERMKPIAAVVEDQVTGFNFPEPEALSPPIIRLEDVSVGYDGRPVLARARPAHRPGRPHRAARPERPGQVDASPSCCPTGWRRWPGARSPPPSCGSATSPSTRWTSSHLDETPMQHIQRLRPDEPPGKIRARLAAGGLGADIADDRGRRGSRAGRRRG